MDNLIGDEKRVTEETYHGGHRNKIPWYPIINYEKCVEYCKLAAYEFEENLGKKNPVVKKPDNCVVFCTGCEE